MSLVGGYRRCGAPAGLDAVRRETLFRLDPISSAIHPVASSMHQLSYPMRIERHAVIFLRRHFRSGSHNIMAARVSSVWLLWKR